MMYVSRKKCGYIIFMYFLTRLTKLLYNNNEVYFLIFERNKDMRIKDGFVLRNVAGMNVVVSTDIKAKFDGMITLNDTGAFMWRLLEEGTDKQKLLERIIEEYEIDENTASDDIDEFVKKLADAEVLAL